MINLASQLARSPRPEMSPEAFARIRTQVLDVHQQQSMQRPIRRLQATTLLNWAAILVITVLFFGTAIFPAAASSLPGELLYALKLGLEEFEVLTAASPAELSVIHLNHAERRLNEAQLLLERGRFESSLLIQGWDSLAKSAEIAQQMPSNDIGAEQQMRAAQVDAALSGVLQMAQQMGIVAPDEIRELPGNLPEADENADSSLAASTATPTSLPQPVYSPTTIPTASPDSNLLDASTNAHIEDPKENIHAEPVTTDQSEATLTPTPVPSLEPVLISPALPTATTGAAFAELPAFEPVETSTDVLTSTPVSSATVATVPTEVAAPYTATVVATHRVNVRSGPGTNFEIIDVIPPWTLVTVIGQNDDESWLYVLLDDDRTGWIAAYLLRAGIVPEHTGNQTNTGDFGCEHPGNYCTAPGYNTPTGNNGDTAPGQGAGGQTNPGDFGCEHPGNYCTAPGYNTPSGNNGDTAPGQGAGNESGNANGGGKPPDSGDDPPNNDAPSTSRGNPHNP